MTGRYKLRLRRPRFTGATTPLATPRQSAGRLVGLGLVAVVIAVVVWVGTTQTLTGQRLADVILWGRFAADLSILEAANDALALVGLTSAVIAGLGLATIALAHGGFGLVGAMTVLLAGANLTSLGLKLVLERPDLLGSVAYAFGNSFPSGTVTLAASIGLAAVLVVPRRLRTPTAVLAAVLVAVIGASTIVAGWHRLADVVGAIAIALAWASLVAGALVVAQGWMPRRTWGHGRGGRTAQVIGLVGLMAVVAGGLGVALVIADQPGLAELIAARASSPGPFIAALAIAIGTALIAFAAYVWAMRGVAFELKG